MSNTITSSLVKKFIPVRKLSSRKGDNGKVLVLGGSYIYHGAPALSSLAALKTGADLVYTCVPKINVQSTRAVSPNLIVIPLVDSKLTRGAVNKLLGQIPNDLDSATIGMGLSIQDPEALKLLVKSLLDRDVRLSLDATALVNYILSTFVWEKCSCHSTCRRVQKDVWRGSPRVKNGTYYNGRKICKGAFCYDSTKGSN